MLLYYIPLWFAVIYSFWTYRQIQKLLEERFPIGSRTPQEEEVIKKVRRLKFYPMTLVVCGIWITIHRFMETVVTDHKSIPLEIISVFFTYLQGFLNAIVYGMNDQVRRSLKKSFTALTPCLQRIRERRGSRGAEIELNMNEEEPR